MKKIFYIIFISFYCFSCQSQNKQCRANYSVISFTAFTKNRVTKEKIKADDFDYKKIKIDMDSLNCFLQKLEFSKDSLYNIRLYGKLSCVKPIKEIFIDKNGIIEVDNKIYKMNKEFIRFIFRTIPEKDREQYIPEWLGM